MVAVINVSAASLMENASFGNSLLIAFGLMALGVVMGIINGGLIVLTGVPDIVVTLAMSFVWGGAALLIMRTPGGGSPPVSGARHGIFFSDSGRRGHHRAGAGSRVAADPLAPPGLRDLRRRLQPRPRVPVGVNVATTRVLAYAIGGFFAAMGGLAATATTGIGTPYAGTFITLNSVAAIVLGGVSLAGGKGGLVGPVAAAFCLILVPSIMVFQGIDPNYGQVIQGVLIVVVVMLGGLFLIREKR